jgi:AcrR family transcriptional regulator
MTTRVYRLGRRQATVDQTRARILKAARAVLMARGTAEFSIEGVAQRARVTRATVYQRFGSRAKLLEALFDDLAQQGGVGSRQAFTQPDRQGARVWVTTFGRFWTAHRPIHRRLLALAALDHTGTRPCGRARVAPSDCARSWRGCTSGTGTSPKAHEETVDPLFALTSFQTFDMLEHAHAGGCHPGRPASRERAGHVAILTSRG